MEGIRKKGWRMVKSETRREAEILVRNPSPRLVGKKFQDSKKVKTNHAKTRLRDLSKTLPRFRDPAKIFRDPRFSWYHSPPLKEVPFLSKMVHVYKRFRGWTSGQSLPVYFIEYPPVKQSFYDFSGP